MEMAYIKPFIMYKLGIAQWYTSISPRLCHSIHCRISAELNHNVLCVANAKRHFAMGKEFHCPHDGDDDVVMVEYISIMQK